jgi:hypothetical protein
LLNLVLTDPETAIERPLSGSMRSLDQCLELAGQRPRACATRNRALNRSVAQGAALPGDRAGVEVSGLNGAEGSETAPSDPYVRWISYAAATSMLHTADRDNDLLRGMWWSGRWTPSGKILEHPTGAYEVP